MAILLFTFVSLHLLVTVLFAVKIVSWKSRHSADRPSVSLIIAARNEVQNLQILIPQLLDQDYEDFEIIIGLDRCSDASVSYLETVQDNRLKWIDLQIIPEDWNSKKYTLNEAIQNSKNEWLLFTDADCIPKSNEWITSMISEISPETNVLVGVSPYLPTKTLLGQFNQFEAFMTFFLYSALHILKKPYMAVGRNMGIRKKYFLDSGGYESIKEIKGGDDDLFIQKANRASIALVLGRNSLIYTYPSKHWNGYLRQKFRHVSVSGHYSRKDLLILTSYHSLHLGSLLLLTVDLQSSFLIPVILFYLFIKFVSYSFVSNKIGAGFNYILLPIVDVLYAFMIPFIGIWSKLIKDIEWRN